MSVPDVVEICSRLLAIDTSNYGDDERSGERAAAEFIMELLEPVGYRPAILESAPRRANVVLRVPGQDPSLPGFLVHGHTDVVPVEREQWSVDPFGGEVRDGYLWGRGATDMKDAVSMMLHCLLRWQRDGIRPRRDIVFAFVADEETSGRYGAQWLVREHPELFDGVGGAIGESGGFLVPVADPQGAVHRFYPIATAERGIMHLAVTARGTAGHGAQRDADNSVARLVTALARVAAHRWPMDPPATVREFFDIIGKTLGLTFDLSSHEGFDAALLQIGDLEDCVRSTAQVTSNPTVLRAGGKVNVIPSVAHAQIDVRTLPGAEQEALRVLEELLGDGVEWEFLENRPGQETTTDTEWYRAMKASIEEIDPGAVVIPRMLGGGTDAKSFAQLGIACYGFTPMTQDPDGRAGAGMHGVDERVPVAALRGGTDMMYRFLSAL